MPHCPVTLSRFIPHAIFAALVLFAVAWGAAFVAIVPLPNGANDFNSPGFVVKHAWVKFALLATRPFRDDLSRPREDALVARFFALNKQIAAEARTGGDPSTPPDTAAAARQNEAALRDERSNIENSVELILEGRLTRVIKEAGLTRHFGGDIVWPPVNIEFQDPPAVLVKSPRAEIRKESESLLQGDLSIERVRQIEAGAERDGVTSALVVQISGIAMYPAIIPPGEDYRYILQDIAHEWMHHYLFFAPLGRSYFQSAKLATLNETVANMVGRDLGDRLFAEYPLEQPPSYVTIAPLAAPAPLPDNGGAIPRGRAFVASPSLPSFVVSAAPHGRPLVAPSSLTAEIDFTTEMRNLRRQVDALLADGKIAEAEQAMEQKREFFEANGIYIRRINQAYFAFNGSYADTPGSIDPIGPKLDALRVRQPALRTFVATVREFTSEDDLDNALAATQPAAPP